MQFIIDFKTKREIEITSDFPLDKLHNTMYTLTISAFTLMVATEAVHINAIPNVLAEVSGGPKKNKVPESIGGTSTAPDWITYCSDGDTEHVVCNTSSCSTDCSTDPC